MRGDLELIAQLVAERSGTVAAQERLEAIAAVLRSLERTPRRGSLRDEILPGLRAIPAGRRTVIAFRVDEARDEVRVLAIATGGADWEGRIRHREGG